MMRPLEHNLAHIGKATVEYSGSNISLSLILCYDIVYRRIGTMIKRHTWSWVEEPTLLSQQQIHVNVNTISPRVTTYGSQLLEISSICDFNFVLDPTKKPNTFTKFISLISILHHIKIVNGFNIVCFNFQYLTPSSCNVARER
jgi:hypothetical protein